MSTKIISPIKLFEQVSKGTYPKYKHNILNDRNLCELENLKQKYLQTLSLEDKKALLLKEREIIYEELEHPEFTLARNYGDMANLVYRLKAKGEKLVQVIKNINYSALMRIEEPLSAMLTSSAEKAKYKDSVPQEKIVLLLKDGLKNAKDSNKPYIATCIKNSYLYIDAISPFSKDIDKQCRKLILGKKGFKTTPKTPFKKLQDIFVNANMGNIKTLSLVNKLLKSNSIDKETRQLAILAGGKFKSKENFEILKNIALDKNEKSPIARSNAIQSVALYIRKNPEEVKQVLETIKNENSVFSPLARILLDKLNGSYHGQKDRALNYNLFGYSDVSSAREKINKIVGLDTGLNTQLSNKSDEGIMPYINVFKDKMIHLTDDTYTKYKTDEAAVRSLFPEKYPNTGYFMDSIIGVSSKAKGALVSKDKMKDSQNVCAHELGHSLNYLFENSRPERKLKRLYNEAVKNKNCLDYYAELDTYEYFAQGCEAYASIYKPHNRLLSATYDNCEMNTRYKLMEKDFELYKFIETMLERFSEQNP